MLHCDYRQTSCPTVTLGRKTTDANFFRLTVWVLPFPDANTINRTLSSFIYLSQRARELSPFALDQSLGQKFPYCDSSRTPWLRRRRRKQGVGSRPDPM